MIVKHPAFPANIRTVPDEDAERWKAAGWLPVDEACPTCGATGDVPCITPSGNETKRHKARPPA